MGIPVAATVTTSSTERMKGEFWARMATDGHGIFLIKIKG